MTYCGSSLYRNNSCGCNGNRNSSCGCNGSRNSGAGCVCDNNGNCSCSNGVGGCTNSNSCGCNSGFFPPRPAMCNTCPPGTFPCPCRPFPWYPPYNNGCGCGGGGNNENYPVARAGTFAFLNSSGTTLTTGSIVPLRYVLGTGNLAKNTSGGSISLDSGTYTASYSISGVTPDAGTTVTITPEYGGTLHPEYSRSFTSTVAGDSFELSGLLGMTLPTDTTLTLNVTTTGDATADNTVTGVNASMIINKICDIMS